MGTGLKEWRGAGCKTQPHYFAQDSKAFFHLVACKLIHESCFYWDLT